MDEKQYRDGIGSAVVEVDKSAVKKKQVRCVCGMIHPYSDDKRWVCWLCGWENIPFTGIKALFCFLSAVASLQSAIEDTFRIKWNELRNAPIEVKTGLSFVRALINDGERTVHLDKYVFRDWRPAIITVRIGYEPISEQFFYADIGVLAVS